MWSSQRVQSSQSTEINVPIHIVWNRLTEFYKWREWNPSIRLTSELYEPKEGAWGKAGIVRRNNNKNGEKKLLKITQTFDKISREDGILSWTMKKGFFHNRSCMTIIPAGDKKAMLTYTQTIHGPVMSFGNASQILMMNAACINGSFKNHVEQMYFQCLLNDVSTREMTKSSITFSSDGDEPAVSADFWQTPPKLRKEVVSQFVEEVSLLIEQ